MSSSNDTSVADTVSRIVHRVACTEGHEQAATAAAPPLSTGPLTLQELSDLSLLCTSSPQKQQQQGFATVEGDQLLVLLELLDRHIDHAVGVNFYPQAIELLQQQESPSRASAALDKVSY